MRISRAVTVTASSVARSMNRVIRTAGLSSVVIVGSMTLSGCAASRLMMRYGDLETQTEMSESVFLELRSELPKTVFVAESSTLDHDVTILPSLERSLIESGYALAETPEEATYLLQINHLRLAEVELSEDQTLGDAVSAALAAGGGAALAADILGASGTGTAGVGLAVGVVGFVADATTKHIAYTLTTDVLLTETTSEPGNEDELIYHGTRIVSGASKVNLSLEEAFPPMVQGMSVALSGLLPRTAR